MGVRGCSSTSELSGEWPKDFGKLSGEWPEDFGEVLPNFSGGFSECCGKCSRSYVELSGGILAIFEVGLESFDELLGELVVFGE